ncbi:MAG TPA: ATPase, partial [Ornithinibacter sp.]|nr:ATPase [Ornithinibacter sp.]
EQGWVEFGASPRGSINLVHAGRALALLRGRDYVLPGDVADVAHDVMSHRLLLSFDAVADGVDPRDVVAAVLAAVAPPRVAPSQEHDGSGSGLAGVAPSAAHHARVASG